MKSAISASRPFPRRTAKDLDRSVVCVSVLAHCLSVVGCVPRSGDKMLAGNLHID